MTDPYIGEIRMVGFNYVPHDWARCDGSILEINQHQALYNIIGNLYGGDGETTFALPDLRGRVPIHVGDWHQQGEKGGAEQIVMNPEQLPAHSHAVQASEERARELLPSDNFLAVVPRKIYGEPSDLTPLHSGSALFSGEGEAHDNRQPYLTVNFIISLAGQLPSRNSGMGTEF